MNKLVDSIQRNTLIKDFEKTLNQDQLYLIRILLDVKIAGKYGTYKSKFFNMDTEAPQ